MSTHPSPRSNILPSFNEDPVTLACHAAVYRAPLLLQHHSVRRFKTNAHLDLLAWE